MGVVRKRCCLRRDIGEVVLIKDGMLFKEGDIREGCCLRRGVHYVGVLFKEGCCLRKGVV